MQLFFSGLLTDEEAIQLLKDKAQRIERTLSSFPEKYRLGPNYEHDEPERTDFFHWLTLDSAIFMRYAMLEWIEGAIERIRDKDYRRGREGAIRRWPPYLPPSLDELRQEEESEHEKA